MESNESSTPKEKLELLRYFHDHCQSEANFLRDRQDKLFTWSSNILFAIIAGLFVVDRTKLVTLTQDPVTKSIASIAIILFAWFSIHWQNRNREWQRQNLEVVTKIDLLLHAFEKGYFDSLGNTSLFPKEWEQTTRTKKLTLLNRIRRVNYISAIGMLALFGVAMIWAVG
jgi:hypothetical protein